MNAAVAVNGNLSVVFTQSCTKHAKFWQADPQNLAYRVLDLVVPLRDPREYPMSREAFNNKGAWTQEKKASALREAFDSMEAKLKYVVKRMRANTTWSENGPEPGGILLYLKDTLEVSPKLVAAQILDFFGLSHTPFSRDAKSLADAVSKATTLPDAKKDEHAWTVKHSALDKAAHGRALCKWYGLQGWRNVEALWRQKEAQGALTVALFPWERLPCDAFSAEQLAATPPSRNSKQPWLHGARRRVGASR